MPSGRSGDQPKRSSRPQTIFDAYSAQSPESSVLWLRSATVSRAIYLIFIQMWLYGISLVPRFGLYQEAGSNTKIRALRGDHSQGMRSRVRPGILHTIIFWLCHKVIIFIKWVRLKRGRRRNHETLFLSVLVGVGRSCFGHILVASNVGQMGDRRRSCDPGYYEPFLPDVLLPKHEEI